MKNRWLSCAVLAFTLLASPAWAGDSQALKDCMARKQSKDSTLSTDELKNSCKDELKMKPDKRDQTAPPNKGDPAPQTASPRNPPQ